MTAPFRDEAGEVCRQFQVDPAVGLSAAEAARRLERYGANQLREAGRRGAWSILVDQATNVVFALLLGAALVSFAFAEIVQGIAILVAILINVGIGFGMELQATRSMAALRALDRSTARVRRDGTVAQCDAAGLVPGDIVLLEAGDVVPGDLRLIETSRLRLNESALTGEAVPVAKTPEALSGEPPLAERANMAFKSTSVSNGDGLGVVVATGMASELGQISELVETAAEEGSGRSLLQRRLDQLGRWLLLVILVVAVLVAGLGLVGGRDLLLMITIGVALVVAAVPEGLPIVASLALARGMWRLAKRDALIEKLTAVETLGATNIICSDKTGTLTENRMTLGRFVLASGVIELTGKERDRGFERDGEAIDPASDPVFQAALEIAVLCNTASLANGGGEPTGDPMELALLEGGSIAGLARPALLERLPELRKEAFDAADKMMATFHRADDGIRIAVKGAPEAVLEVADHVLTADAECRELTDDERRAWHERNETMAAAGLRALALAERSVGDEAAEPYRNLTLVGLVGLVDPPRAEVVEAIAQCRRAGIRVVMVTGDQPSTAVAIAHAVGLIDDPAEAKVVLGSELKPASELAPAEREALLETSIFARFDPKQKLDLIELYQAAGLIVTMTGDGVNDAPALERANIGVAMGQRGTDVAREAADMVLRDDSFASIVAAIRQGRVIFGNIRRFIVYMLSGNTGEIVAVSVVALLNAPLPLLPLQILYINIVSDVFPALALGVGEGRQDVMREPPRDPEEPILTRRHWLGIGGYGCLIGGSALAVFWAAFQFGMSETEAVTVSFLTFGFARLWHVFNMRAADSGLWQNEITTNPFVWWALALGVALMLGAVHLPGVSLALEIEPPDPLGWSLIAIGSLVPLLVGQGLKLGARRPQG